MSFINKRVLAIFRIVRFAVGVAGMVWLYNYKSDPEARRRDVLKEASLMAFNGKVDSVYRQTQNHNVKTVRLINGYTYVLWPEWEELVDVGDSISKKEKELQVKVFKPNGKTVTLDYKEMVKGFK